MNRLVVALVALLALAASAHAAPCPPNGQPCINTITTDGNGNVIVPGTPSALTQTPLDVSTVTTGGTAVTALNAGHRAHGGWIQNPVGATQPLCINEIGTASGTTSSGNTTCIQPGQTYTLAPGAGAVSVISSDSAHAFSGMGLN